VSPVVRGGLTVVAAVAVALFVVLGVQRIIERQQTVDEINRLREELYRTRLSADRCRGSLQTSEAALHSLGATIDSLRAEVDDYETASGQVPEAIYEEYLEVFEEYNDSVAVWEGRERRLRSAEASCRSTIERHNALSDSLQTVLEDAGIETG
jgi:chromosome segregation ATPase